MRYRVTVATQNAASAINDLAAPNGWAGQLRWWSCSLRAGHHTAARFRLLSPRAMA